MTDGMILHIAKCYAKLIIKKEDKEVNLFFNRVQLHFILFVVLALNVSMSLLWARQQ